VGGDTTDIGPQDVEPEELREPAPEQRYGAPLTWSHGQAVLHATPATYLDLIGAAHDDGFLMCVDLTGADYLAHPGRTGLPTELEAQRFEVVVNLISHARGERLRVRVQVPEAEPVLPTLFALYPGTEAMERETFDMFGITFDGHPDLTRILMPEDWVGHPLRKDYDPGRIPVQFKGAPANR
jgi:NADH:ubiquinone oxidoreductase subunit C